MTVKYEVAETTARAVNPFRENLQKREIPSLTGLRGIAALAIVAWHYLDAWHLSYLFPGPFAVTLFFELSGLLITWLLLTEMETTGEINLRQFYLRRALRLFPVFYAVWALCCLSGPFPGRWAYFFYMGDYYTAIKQNYSVMTQAWSLGVEEKFYLIWPLLLVRIPARRLINVSIAVLILEPLYRLLLSHFGFQKYTWFAFDSKLDSIVLGCLIALLVKRGWVAPKWLSHPLVSVTALIGIFVCQHVSDVVTYLLAIILVSVICRPGPLLNNPVVRYLGAISYSLYLVHPYAKDLFWPRLAPLLHLNSVAAIMTCQLVVATASASLIHFTVERPFLKLKNLFHKRATVHA